MITNTILQEKLSQIDDIFSEIITTKNDILSHKISDILADMFHKNITVTVVSPIPNTLFYGMCVFPDKSDIDKIVDVIVYNKSNRNAIRDIWKKADNWTLEIDNRLLSDLGFTARELTALLLHEVGHIIISDSVPSRISVIIGLEYARLPIAKKSLFKTDIFKQLVALPVINACRPEISKDLRMEIRADRYCIRCGYREELVSALKKLSTLAELGTPVDDTKGLQNGVMLSAKIVDQLEARQSVAVHTLLNNIKLKLPSTWVQSQLTDLQQRYGKVGSIPKEFAKTPNVKFESRVSQSQRDEFYSAYIEKTIEDCYVKEFVIGVRKLKRIEPADIDYIELQINDIKTNDDKLMLTSYLYSKLDTIDYYLTLIRSGNKRYVVPHTEEYLVTLQNRLYQLKDRVMKATLPEVTYGLKVGYPDGYDG